jgi:hypothetical protein
MALAKAELIAALLDAFDLASFDNMLDVRVQKRREEIVVAGSLTDIVTTVVIKAERDRWASALIRGALAAVPENPKLLQFVKKYDEWNPEIHGAGAAANHFQSIFMRGRRVFLKRPEFRRLLQLIGTSENSRVLAIDGDRCTGKTYSRDFLHFVGEAELVSKNAKHKISYVYLDDCAFEPESLALALGFKIGLKETTLPQDRGEQAARRIPALVEWLGQGIQSEDGTDLWWLVLDGFRIQVHPSATHDLIRALIDATDREWDRVRLILINYARFLDIDTSAYILCEETQPLERADVEEFFRHVYQLSNKQWDEASVQTAVTFIYSQVDSEMARRQEQCRMKILSAALTIAAKKLLN